MYIYACTCIWRHWNHIEAWPWLDQAKLASSGASTALGTKSGLPRGAQSYPDVPKSTKLEAWLAMLSLASQILQKQPLKKRENGTEGGGHRLEAPDYRLEAHV